MIQSCNVANITNLAQAVEVTANAIYQSVRFNNDIALTFDSSWLLKWAKTPLRLKHDPLEGTERFLDQVRDHALSFTSLEKYFSAITCIDTYFVLFGNKQNFDLTRSHILCEVLADVGSFPEIRGLEQNALSRLLAWLVAKLRLAGDYVLAVIEGMSRNGTGWMESRVFQEDTNIVFGAYKRALKAVNRAMEVLK